MGYDPFDHEVMIDPQPHYRRLRQESPVLYLEEYDAWFLSRFDDVWEAASSDALTATEGVTPDMLLLRRPPGGDPVFSMLDRPLHRIYRRPVAAPYRATSINELEAEVRADVRSRLVPLTDAGTFDVYADLALPVVTTGLASMLGVSVDDARDCVDQVTRMLRRHRDQRGSDGDNMHAAAELYGNAAHLIAKHRPSTGSDDTLIAGLRRAEIDGEPMSAGSMASTLLTLVVTGTEVVPLCVANTVGLLARHPEQLGRVIDNPTLTAAAVEESLRYDQPTNMLGRLVQRPLSIGGQTLTPGQAVMFLWASANRDEAEFPDADRFDIDRRPARTLSFGHGIHRCLGEHLGRLQANVILEELFAAVPRFSVDFDGAARLYGEFLGGYARLPITVRS